MVQRMNVTIAFDVYGTLIDPLGIARDLEDLVGARSGRFAVTWREKQLEYLFRRGLGRDYEPFSVCTAQALDYTCRLLDVQMSSEARRALMERYRDLPAYSGAADALRSLVECGCCCFAFSNGEPEDLEVLLDSAGLGQHLAGIVSVHEVRSFKPDPRVYEHFLDSTGSRAEDTWLVSGNPFDVIGASSVGWKTAWLCRDPDTVFDPWGVEPSVVVESLGDLVPALAG